ncbi:FAD-dependent thiol oxidase [Obba rivulosa]|uniref:Sulfhydryl oxidase n=1 Tax=Obba rivulosa TaxID=1052685 RepID=A0A8E2DJF8_9APHY|nr:FAD-dependent thiol oxidase [Obba rivulosa]
MPSTTSDASSAPTSSAPPPSSKPLPPGMVIGPDGKPCKICTAFRQWKPPAPAAPSSPNETAKQSQSQSTQSTAALMAALASGSATVTPTAPKPPLSSAPADAYPEHCPPDVERLGRSTWTFLHTTAAYFPERPSPGQRANMLLLLHALPTLYPCGHCAEHLGREMERRPPDVRNRVALSRWLCETHNEVNERLGKERFDCSIRSLDERWKDGPSDGSCG